MFFNRHKSALDDLQQTLTQQNGLLDAINRSMAVIEFDLDAVVLSANDNFLKTMGYRAEQAIGQPHRLFCTPEFGRSAQYSELWSRLKRGEFQSGTFERINSKGESVWLEASYNPIKDARRTRGESRQVRDGRHGQGAAGERGQCQVGRYRPGDGGD